MNDQARTDDRLTALEIKASFSEDLVDELNQIVARQQRQIDQLTRALAALQHRVSGLGDGATAARSLRDELPPHY